MMNYAIQLLTLLLLLVGCIGVIVLSIENDQLGEELIQLEAELGRMPIDDPSRVHVVEIETPDVPPEVASHIDAVWQFRCYLPPGYDFKRMSGGGRVAETGIYQSGGFGSSWSSPQKEAIHKLLTVSFQRKKDHLQTFYSFGNTGGTSSWSHFNPDHFDAMVVQQLVSSDQGPRSFDIDTVLPLLKIYDPSTAEAKEVAGKTLNTYVGGLVLLCPKSRQTEVDQLRKGETPSGFDPSWIATEAGDE